MFEFLWSDHLLAEVERVLVDYKGLTGERAIYFCDCIRKAFPKGRVAPEQYLPLVASRSGPDPADHVHSAAAVAGINPTCCKPPGDPDEKQSGQQEQGPGACASGTPSFTHPRSAVWLVRCPFGHPS